MALGTTPLPIAPADHAAVSAQILASSIGLPLLVIAGVVACCCWRMKIHPQAIDRSKELRHQHQHHPAAAQGPSDTTPGSFRGIFGTDPRDPGRFLLELVQNPAPDIHLRRSLDVKTGRVLHPEWLRGEARALGAGRLHYVGICYSCGFGVKLSELEGFVTLGFVIPEPWSSTRFTSCLQILALGEALGEDQPRSHKVELKPKLGAKLRLPPSRQFTYGHRQGQRVTC
ncbi:hypothetical protein Anapl_10464 [Anas platyrhynchos]|uniref:Uncharacterized protein n=1 Tax=Anas platyrhynchos TaxID=8839 RepID=R0KF64_ANAPL|nr:hypothetical protein Anapl_10464 [Anas platyrhynchos]